MKRSCWLWCTLALVPLAAAFECPVTEDASASKRLKIHLLCNYDTQERPVKNLETVVNVTLNLFLKHIVVVDSTNRYELYSWVVLHWLDEFLIWDPKSYENISLLLLPSYNIWVPDATVFNSDLSQVTLFEHAATECRVQSHGAVLCVARLSTPVFCQQALGRWPFDTQNCSLTIGSWGHTHDQISLNLDDEVVGLVEGVYEKNNEYEIVSVEARKKNASYCCPPTPYFYLVFHFELRHHAAVFAAAVVAPAFVLAGVMLTSFWVRGVAVRAGLCCASLLGDALFLQFIAGHIVASGDSNPGIVSFYRDAMVLCVVSLVVALGVERSRQPDDDGLRPGSSSCVAPRWLTGGAAWLRGRGGRAGQLLLGEGDAEGQTPSTDKEEEGPPQCRVFATLLDRTAFLAVLITYAILLLALLP